MGQCSNQRKELNQLHVTKLSAILNVNQMFNKILHTTTSKNEVQASIKKEHVTIDKRYIHSTRLVWRSHTLRMEEELGGRSGILPSTNLY